MKAVIIEDEMHAATMLREMLKDIDPSIQITAISGDLPSGIKSIRKYEPELVFLDIELPVYSGIQLLDFFNPEEINFSIIFTTAFNQYAIRAFEMSAVDYLLKPIQEEKLRAALDKLVRAQWLAKTELFSVLKDNLAESSKKKIVVPVFNGFEILNVEQIVYLEADGSYARIYFENGSGMTVSRNLKHFEFTLSACHNFVRIHRSFLINIHYLKKIVRKNGSQVVLHNDFELPIAEDRVEGLLNLFRQL